jgi:SAM-dependent methyltransferase
MKLTGLCCPDCHHRVESADSDALRCTGCGRLFNIESGVAVLTPSRMHEMTTSEANYWDWRADQERAALPSAFSDDYLSRDVWGLYGYKDQFASLRSDARILEVGCGTHPKTLFLAQFHGFSNITVSDLSPAQLMVNREYCQGVGLDEKVRHVAADLTALPFPSDEFDVVIVHAALHHVPEIQAAISEMVRCLHPNGRIVIGHEPNRSMIRLIRGIAKKSRLGEKRQAASYSVADDELEGLNPNQIKSLLTALGVRVLREDRQWFLTAFVHPIPLVIKRLTGWSVDTPKPLITATTLVDRKIARIPGIRQLSFHFSVIGEKQAAA